MFDLEHFDVVDLVACREAMRDLGKDSDSLETTAGEVVRFFYSEFGKSEQEKACVLARAYLTLPLSGLRADQRRFAEEASSVPLHEESRCLVLMATAGVEPGWNSPSDSKGHQAIPLVTEEAINQAPMVSQLMQQLGVDVRSLVDSRSEIIVDTSKTDFNVFHIENALNSPHIPAQDDFVVPYGVRSVLGFGSLLPSGELFSVILFSRHHISEATARKFRALTLRLELSLIPHAFNIFAS